MADQGSTDIPLLELTVEAANVASVKLKICRTMLMAYEYTWHGEKKKSKKLVATMVSSDAASYCLGSMTMQKGDEKELEAAQKQLKVGSTWKFHKIVFTNEKNSTTRLPSNTTWTFASRSEPFCHLMPQLEPPCRNQKLLARTF